MQATQIYIYWVKQYIKPYTLTDHLFWGWRYSRVVFLLLTELNCCPEKKGAIYSFWLGLRRPEWF